MRKVLSGMILTAAFAVLLSLTGCGQRSTAESEMIQTKKESESGQQKNGTRKTVTVRQGEQQIDLYELMVSAMMYDKKKKSWLTGDGSGLSSRLPEVAESLPSVVWGEAFTIQIPEGLELCYIEILDEAYMDDQTPGNIKREYPEQEDQASEMTDSERCMSCLEELAQGSYYIAVNVKKEGAYVEAAGKAEYTIYEYAFRLDKLTD